MTPLQAQALPVKPPPGGFFLTGFAVSLFTIVVGINCIKWMAP